jgi:hypothetical protein
VRDELFAGALRCEQYVPDRGGIFAVGRSLFVQLGERLLELVALVDEHLDGLGDGGEELSCRCLVESAKAFRQ